MWLSHGRDFTHRNSSYPPKIYQTTTQLTRIEQLLPTTANTLIANNKLLNQSLKAKNIQFGSIRRLWFGYGAVCVVVIVVGLG